MTSMGRQRRESILEAMGDSEASLVQHGISIEHELTEHMRRLPRTGENEQRDIQIVLSWYGLRSAPRPTLEEIAAEFGIGTRERVRQLIDKRYRQWIARRPLPVLTEIADQLQQQYCIEASEFLELLRENGYIWPATSIQGLLLLLHESGLADDFDLYSPSFHRVTRGVIGNFQSIFLVRNSEAKVLREYFKAASDLPGMLGIANLKELSERQHWPSIRTLAIWHSIRSCGAAWFKEDAEDRWYSFENRENVFAGYCEKAFSVIQAAEVTELADCFSNALRARSHKFTYPPSKVIAEYLAGSARLRVDGQIVRGRGHADSLTEIERDIVGFFEGRSSASYQDLATYLEQQGHSRPLIVKSTMTSPIVVVDKTGGRRNFVYRLVASADVPQVSDANQRYEFYREKLRQLLDEGTDEEVNSTRRKEQALLQDWLFAGKKTERCAICGRIFGVQALIAAHKKKRANCLPAERLDPHIVMPLCTFGCDFLYERGYIYFDGFTVAVDDTFEAATADYVGAKALAGVVLHEEFRGGGDSYLRRRRDF